LRFLFPLGALAAAFAAPSARRITLLIVCASTAFVLFDGRAQAAQLIDRDASQIHLQVGAADEALVTYTAAGSERHVLAWGAVNALAPSEGRPQVRFRLDYAGGWGKYRKTMWPAFADECGPYTGPRLAWLVTACTGPDGSFWALQSFPAALPDLGFDPWLPEQSSSWLELSHWTGPLAKLELHNGWVYNGRYQRLFGRLSYKGKPVYGYTATRYGVPTDGYGRLLFLDTYNSAYGPGWRRENSFLAHTGTGGFCYGFFPRDPTRNGYRAPANYSEGLRGPGTGARYRVTASGPGVTPDVFWEGSGFHAFDPLSNADLAYQEQSANTFQQLLAGDGTCHA
jgi:hypothetical protein